MDAVESTDKNAWMTLKQVKNAVILASRSLRGTTYRSRGRH